MYELSVACKYLLPRWRQLSVSVISLISVLVIALVVWLIVIFFSVTNGLEKYWVGKFVTLAAPIRITPTDAYYRSYYYQIDNISDASDYQHKSIAEKLASLVTDPYDPNIDEELPSAWPVRDRDAGGETKDLVKGLFETIQQVPGLTASPYETTFGNIRLRLARGAQHRARNFRGEDGDQAFLTQATLVGSLEMENPTLRKSLIALTTADVTNLVSMAGTAATQVQADTSDSLRPFEPHEVRQRISNLFNHLTITQLTPPPEGWSIPRHLLPASGRLEAVAIMGGERVMQFVLPSQVEQKPYLLDALKKAGYKVLAVDLEIAGKKIVASADGKALPPVSNFVPLTLPHDVTFPAKLVEGSLEHLSSVEEAQFQISLPLQQLKLEGIVPLRGLDVAAFNLTDRFIEPPKAPPQWVYHVEAEGSSPIYHLPSDAAVGEGVLLPKAFKEAGILAGDRGYVSYYAPTPSSAQEQRVPVYVAGFYDPGMIPMGGKLIFVNAPLTSMMRAAYGQQDRDNGNGVRVRFNDYGKAEALKAQIEEGLQQRGINRYWNVETFRNYEFAKEILQQQRSDKNLFMVIAGVIIIVACSNIISMLIILVNDKKVEIGILRSMGATSRSIALIFGSCGFAMGVIGSLVGLLAATATLHHLDQLIAFLGMLQGHDLFNPTFYGESLPNELSFEALTFVLAVTATFSLLAGVVPAIKASLLKPSSILRAE